VILFQKKKNAAELYFSLQVSGSRRATLQNLQSYLYLIWILDFKPDAIIGWDAWESWDGDGYVLHVVEVKSSYS
jgi:hypothetical protein